MTGSRIVLWSVFAAFLGLTAYALAQHGLLGFFALANANWATRLLAADLVIALSLVVVWMLADARARGTAVAPYLLVTLTLGSAGPLLYLIRRKAGAEAKA